jgi:hypothetical protein
VLKKLRVQLKSARFAVTNSDREARKSEKELLR